jgi:hypothetical protein
MPRGGKRQGTPGKAYSNRTDLMASMKPPAPGGIDPTAAGGMTAAPPAAPTGPPQSQAPMPTPEDTPMLTGATQYPDEPLTAGLSSGPGSGPVMPDRAAERVSLKRYLPLITPYLDAADTPDSVKMLYRLIKAS